MNLIGVALQCPTIHLICPLIDSDIIAILSIKYNPNIHSGMIDVNEEYNIASHNKAFILVPQKNVLSYMAHQKSVTRPEQ